MRHRPSFYDQYKPGLAPENPGDRPERWLVFSDMLMLTRSTEAGPEIPGPSVITFFTDSPQGHLYLGEYRGEDYYCIAVPGGAEAPAGHAFSHLRALGKDFPYDLFMLAGRASQILHWDSQSRFCGRCGAPTRMKDDERAKICDACGNLIFPRISPAIIIAIIKDDQILLAHNKNFRPSLHSVVAGFMEPGETFEDTARREVFEEVGIKIGSIRYFASQPWPFPDSLMIGLFGAFESGEIQVDGIEIESAGWYWRDDLPEIPDTTSIAGRMIRWYIDHPDPLAALAERE